MEVQKCGSAKVWKCKKFDKENRKKVEKMGGVGGFIYQSNVRVANIT